MKRAWRTLAAWSTSALVLAGAPLWADPPAADPIAQVEQFHGLTRVDQPQKKAEPETKVRQAEAEQPPSIPALPTLTPLPSPSLPAVPLVALPTPEVAPAPLPQVVAQPVRESLPRGEAPSSTQTMPNREKGEAEQTAEPGKDQRPVPSTHGRGPGTKREPPVDSPAQGTPKHPWVQVASALAGTLLTPLAVLLGLWLILQKMKGGTGPVLRVEYVGGQQSIPLNELAGLLQGSLARQAAPPPPAPEPVHREPPIEETTAEAFDVGPSFEEERLIREQQSQHQDEGVLRQLFEDNLKLQKQLKELDTVLA